MSHFFNIFTKMPKNTAFTCKKIEIFGIILLGGKKMETLIIVLLAVAIAAALVFVIFSRGQKDFLSLSLKSVASFCFTLLVVGICYIKGLSLPALFFVMGLIASCFGDVILALPDMPEMQQKSMLITLIGGLCFTVAHIGYMIGMILIFGFAWWVILIAVALGLLFSFGNQFLGKLDYGKLKFGMPVYGTFVSLVVAQSIYAVVSGVNMHASIMLLVGFILFWLSDIVLMHIYFNGKPEKKQFLYYFNLSFYYGAQILIASSLIYLL